MHEQEERRSVASGAKGSAVGGEDENHPAQTVLMWLAISQASELARAGRYSEADQLLSEIKTGDTSAAVLDLRARIHAQQGKLSEAEALWTRAIHLDPANLDYGAALQRISRMQTRRLAALRPLLSTLAALLCVVGVVSAVYLIERRRAREFRAALVQRPVAPTTAPPERHADAVAAAAAQAGQAEQAERTEARVSASPATLAPALDIDVPGVRSSTDGDATVLMFDAGLFARGIELRPEGKAVLSALGKQLAPYAGRVAVNVVGHTSSLPVTKGRTFRDNGALGMQRAVTVVDYLRGAASLPPQMFSASSAGESRLPQTNPQTERQTEDAAFQQTVVLRVSGVERQSERPSERPSERQSERQSGEE
jgi:type VI secretion system protein ImpK